MALNISKITSENRKGVQGETNVYSRTDTLCDACGESNPEYVLDTRKLCFDCYKAEKYYWAKACAPI
jgi:formamidopyrimidine-DNA glycosylase